MNNGAVNDGAVHNTILRLNNIRKTYGKGDTRLEVLRGVNVELQAGEMVALVGPSGSGKSTLLHIMALLDHPDAGEMVIGDKKIGKSDASRTLLRRSTIGVVYQFHHLLPEFSAAENVMLPQIIAGVSRRAAATRAALLLEQVGLANRGHHRPAELSGGEQQRVAIARALANAPPLLVADEPTGNLDQANAVKIFALLREICLQQRITIFMATHNQDLARQCTRVIEMREGIVKPFLLL